MDAVVVPLASCGVRVDGADADAKRLSGLPADAEAFVLLGQLMRTHGLLWLRSEDERELAPAQIRALYTSIHRAAWPGVELDMPRAVDAGEGPNLRGVSFPGFAETHCLGKAERVENWHGLTGTLRPTGHWEREHGQWHHDGGFCAGAPPPPMLIAMTCAEVPRNGSGATLFYDSSAAMRLAGASALAQRARRMLCVYTSGFDRVVDGVYPVMSTSMLVPVSQSPRAKNDCADAAHSKMGDEFRRLDSGVWASNSRDGGSSPRQPLSHRLVQRGGARRGVGEYVVVHTVCLDHLEEEDEHGGSARALGWEESMAFIEDLLGPAASQRLCVQWRPGDMVGLLWPTSSMETPVSFRFHSLSRASFVATLRLRPCYWIPTDDRLPAHTHRCRHRHHHCAGDFRQPSPPAFCDADVRVRRGGLGVEEEDDEDGDDAAGATR